MIIDTVYKKEKDNLSSLTLPEFLIRYEMGIIQPLPNYNLKAETLPIDIWINYPKYLS